MPAHIPPGTHWFTDLKEAIAMAEKSGETELFVVGGAEIYALAMPLADRMYVSIIKLDSPVMGDTWFPQWQPNQWRIVQRRESGAVTFLTYDRLNSDILPLHHILPAHERGV